MRDDQGILVQRGQRPEVVIRPNYLTDARFRDLASPNPFYSRDEPEPEPHAFANDNVIPFPAPLTGGPRE